jgi:hypothetical protein
VDIIIGGTSAIKPNTSEENATLPIGKKRKKTRKDRRKNSQDRRKSVREGIFVSLSVKHDRRRLRDRRTGS